MPKIYPSGEVREVLRALVSNELSDIREDLRAIRSMLALQLRDCEKRNKRLEKRLSEYKKQNKRLELDLFNAKMEK